VRELSLLTAPTVEPLDLVSAKQWLRVTHAAEDAGISALVSAARQQAESFTERAIATQTFRLLLDEFAECIALPRPPVQSVTAVQYQDSSGVWQTVSTSVYRLVTAERAAWIERVPEQTWPAVRPVSGAVRIDYLAGYTATPPELLMAIKFYLLDLYERDSEAAAAAERLARPFRLGVM
jgi:uncharacterized phiE125 gp8 family phage protein